MITIILFYEENSFVQFICYRKKYLQDDAKESEPQEDDPWAGLPYTVDLETGKLIYDVYLLPAIYVAYLKKNTHKSLID